MSRFDRDLEAPVSFKKATRYTPDHEYMIQMVVQAFAIGIVVYIALLLLCAGARWSLRWAAVGASLAILLILAINYWMQWKDERLWQQEEILGHDLNQDGYIGKPPQLNVTIPITERNMEFAGLPGPANAIIAWSRAAVSGHSLAYENWQPLFGEYMSPMGRKIDLYREFRRACSARKLIIEQGTHSCSLTEDGKVFFMGLSTKTIDDMTPLLDG